MPASQRSVSSKLGSTYDVDALLPQVVEVDNSVAVPQRSKVNGVGRLAVSYCTIAVQCTDMFHTYL